MNNIVKDTIILLLITLISGVGLGAVYNITKEPRKQQEEKAKNEAYQNVFPEAKTFADYNDYDSDEVADYIVERDAKTKAEDKDNSNKDINAVIDTIVTAYDNNGEILGYVITVTDKEAYGGEVQFTVGISNDKVIKGISFLSIDETPGLGMKANDDSYKEQFKDKAVDYVKYTKTESTDVEAVDALSGATITSNAVTNGVSAAIYCFDYITGGEANE